MSENFEGTPQQGFLEENRESLEELLETTELQHVLSIAQRAERDIRTLIEKDIWPAVQNGSPDMKDHWEQELHKWQGRLQGIEAFIDKYTSNPS